MPENNSLRALCVSIHDVAPHTMLACEKLLRAIEVVADIPVTLLVVPAYHRLPVIDESAYIQFLDHRLSRGDELALHGYAHLDEGPPPKNWREHFKRKTYTLSEGEFSAIDESVAKERMQQGLDWFARHHWPVHGFVAPAWLLSKGAWQALKEFPFEYTTTIQRFYLLPSQRALLSPSLVYTARNAWGRWLSCRWNSILSSLLGGTPLVRLGLHPNDANYPELISHYQKLIERLLMSRVPMTKHDFATAWQQKKYQGDAELWDGKEKQLASKG